MKQLDILKYVCIKVMNVRIVVAYFCHISLLYFWELRSSASKQRVAPKTRLSIGKRAFAVAAPTIWNQHSIKLSGVT